MQCSRFQRCTLCNYRRDPGSHMTEEGKDPVNSGSFTSAPQSRLKHSFIIVDKHELEALQSPLLGPDRSKACLKFKIVAHHIQHTPPHVGSNPCHATERSHSRPPHDCTPCRDDLFRHQVEGQSLPTTSSSSVLPDM